MQTKFYKRPFNGYTPSCFHKNGHELVYHQGPHRYTGVSSDMSDTSSNSTTNCLGNNVQMSPLEQSHATSHAACNNSIPQSVTEYSPEKIQDSSPSENDEPESNSTRGSNSNPSDVESTPVNSDTNPMKTAHGSDMFHGPAVLSKSTPFSGNSKSQVEDNDLTAVQTSSTNCIDVDEDTNEALDCTIESTKVSTSSKVPINRFEVFERDEKCGPKLSYAQKLHGPSVIMPPGVKFDGGVNIPPFLRGVKLGPKVTRDVSSESSDMAIDEDSPVANSKRPYEEGENDDGYPESTERIPTNGPPIPGLPFCQGLSHPASQVLYSSTPVMIERSPSEDPYSVYGKSTASSEIDRDDAKQNKSRQLMKDWLVDKLDSNDMNDVLSWLNKEEGLFRIKWLHKATDSWFLGRDAHLFKQWCIHTGKYDPDNENPRRWKANFRCALNSLPDVVPVPALHVKKGRDAYRVFRVLNEKIPEKVQLKAEQARKRRKLEKPQRFMYANGEIMERKFYSSQSNDGLADDLSSDEEESSLQIDLSNNYDQNKRLDVAGPPVGPGVDISPSQSMVLGPGDRNQPRFPLPFSAMPRFPHSGGPIPFFLPGADARIGARPMIGQPGIYGLTPPGVATNILRSPGEVTSIAPPGFTPTSTLPLSMALTAATIMKSQAASHSQYYNLRAAICGVDYNHHNIQPARTSKFIRLLRIYDSDRPSVEAAITIEHDFSASLVCHNREIGENHEIWAGMPKVFKSVHDITRLLERLNQFVTCVGNPEIEFQDLVSGDSEFLVAYKEQDVGAQLGSIRYKSTVRSLRCPMLIKSGPTQCEACQSLRMSLQQLLDLRARRSAGSQGGPPVDLWAMSKENLKSELERAQAEIVMLQNKFDSSHKK